MFWAASDDVIEETLKEGLTNEIIYYQHRDILTASREKSRNIVDKLSLEERRFICEMKAKSIILPFSKARGDQPHLKQGDMATIHQLLEVIEYLKRHNKGSCIGCPAFFVELSKDSHGKLLIYSSSRDSNRCEDCKLFTTLLEKLPIEK